MIELGPGAVVSSGRPQAAEAAAVIGERHNEPLGGDFFAAAQVEAGKTYSALDDTADRFDGLFAFFVAGFAGVAFEFRFHRQAPGFPDAALWFCLGRRAEIIGPVRLGLGDGDQRLDVPGLQFGHCRAAGKAGIGQHRVRQADRVFHCHNGGREGGLIARGSGHVGGQDQLAALGRLT
jgi:hypothetical protein